VSRSELNHVIDAEAVISHRKGLYKLGGTAVLIAVLVPLAEVAINFLPGVARASQGTVTAVDWFTLFQHHWFLGLRNLGLLNIVGAVLLAPAILAIYSALRRANEAYTGLSTILFFVGMAIYLAGNKAFPMLSLSRQYAVATTDAQRSSLIAAGQAMLAEGHNRAGLLLIEFACLAVSVVMLRGNVFSKATAYAGILGNALLIVVEVILTSTSRLPDEGMILAGAGGLSIMIWYLLVGRRLLQLGWQTRGARIKDRRPSQR
jgi:Domain of unknown function (DUF4386)